MREELVAKRYLCAKIAGPLILEYADCSRPLSTGMDCILTEFAPLFIKKQAQ